MAESECDVCVVGGGPAGIAAAVSAAEAGARTVLIERSDVLGGNAGNALVHTICGLYGNDRDTAEYVQQGFARRFAGLLLDAAAARRAERAGRVWVLPTFPHRLAEVARSLCESTERLSLRPACEVREATAGGDGFRIECDERGGDAIVRAGVAIDASGDASLAHALGATCWMEEPSRLQNPSLIIRVRGVEASETAGFARLRLSHAIARAAIEEKIEASAGSILVRPGPRTGEAYLTLNIVRRPGASYAPLDPHWLAAARARALDDAQEVVDFLRATRPGFAACEIVERPRRVGVRETRRVAGVEVVEAVDISGGRRRDDEVCLSAWPIEIWDDHLGARFTYPAGPSSVPLGALVSRSHDRLGMAGRCISASHEALGALRVIGTALASGEAVGTAAAMAAAGGSSLRALAASRVREQMVASNRNRHA